ncbi:MAG: hypothetical protein EAZ85_12120 [Bacteroidetes bacterium]|nr:MAG: hypothetical protein EAZ85_12120 [Bacteroidota bacterium]TAG87327.1 MAG: hypothetical protein EAZ20_10825 [Bacteroidota bacterium]
MQFVYPQFLWALLTILIPILIHLLNFRRVKIIYFSQVRLLKEVKAETQTYKRIREWLILLARIGAIVFLVLAFAQPFIPSPQRKSVQNSGNLASIYLDNSFSMQNEIGNEKALDLGIRYAQDLLKVFPKSMQFQLLTNNFENIEQYPSSSEKIADRLTKLRLTGNYRNLNIVNQRQNNLVSRYSPNRKNQIFWFSDFQKSTVGDLSLLKLDTTQQFYLVPLRAEKTPNIAVDSLWLENPFVKALETNQINIRIKNYKPEQVNNLSLKLYLNDQQVSTASLNIAANSSAQTTFNFTITEGGKKKGKIVFEDYPITFDNEFFFTLNASPTIEIIQLFEKNTTNFIESVYQNESVFSHKKLNINNLDNDKLKKAELLILDEVNNIEGETANQLQKFVEKGGSLLIYPAQNPSNTFLNFLRTLRINNPKIIENDSLRTGTSAELLPPDIQQPFFRGIFEKIPQNLTMPYANAVLKWADVGENLLKSKTKQATFTRFLVNNGMVYLSNSPLQISYSNLGKHAIFVPLMYKIAALSKSNSERLSYYFSEKTIKIKVNKNQKNQQYELVKDKQKFVPSQVVQEDELTLELPEQITEAGFYELKANNKTENIIALNYDKIESDINFYTPQELQSRFANQKNVQIYDIQKAKNFVQTFKDKNIQYNLWKYMLVIVLIFLAIEIALIRLLK